MHKSVAHIFLVNVINTISVTLDFLSFELKVLNHTNVYQPYW